MTFILAFARDLRLAVRSLRRTPTLTIASVLTLALGIGANTAIFSVVYGVLLRPLPFRDPHGLVQLNAVQEKTGRVTNISLTEFQDWESRARVFDSLALFGFDQFSVTDTGESETVRGAIVSAHFFDVLGARPALGRPLGPDDDGAAMAVVSDRLWRNRFGARADVVGTQATLNGQPYTVIGVAAPQFHFPADDIDVWVPLGFASTSAPPRWKMRGFRAFSMVGRLRAGVSLRQANDDAAQTAQWLEQTYPRFNQQTGVSVTPLAEHLTAAIRPALLMLFAAVGLVLVVACGNVANLSLARSAARRREIAIRMAVGASRRHLVMQFIAESAVLACAGAVVGLLVAQWCLHTLTAFHPAGLPRLDEIRLDLPVLAFTLAVTVLATVLFGTLPGITASRGPAAIGLADIRSTSNPRIRRWHAALIVAEVGISVTLLVGGVLLTRSFVALTQTDIGVRRDQVLTVKLNLSSGVFSQPANVTAFLTRALSAVEATPGVRSAGIVSSLPPNVSQMHTSFSLPNRVTGQPNDFAVDVVAASQNLFTTLGVPLIAGRPFRIGDTENAAHVIVLSATAARRMFPEGDAIGRTFPFGSPDAGARDPEVVGIVGDVKYSGLDAAPDGAVYLPYAQRVFKSTYLVVRTAGNPEAAASGVRRAVLALEPTTGISDVRALDTVVSDAVAQPRFRTWLLMLLAGLAVLMAAVGLYGVLAYAVAQRTPEIGLRMALGASSTNVMAMIVKQGLALTAAGLAVGAAAAYVLSRTLAAFLYGVGPTDAISFALASVFIVAVGVAATLVPARRAMVVDPLVALRTQ